jgi:hypothetical protein
MSILLMMCGPTVDEADYSASLLITRGMATGGGLSPGSVYYIVVLGMSLN